MSIKDVLLRIIENISTDDTGLVKEIRKLSIDKRGEVGEEFIKEL